MLVYLLTAAAAMLAALSAEGLRGEKPKVSNLLWLVVFLALTIPASLRYDIGVDYSASMESAGYLGYWQLYHLYANQPPASGMDPGFYALIRILNLFTDNPQWMFAFLSAATYALVIRACHRLSPDPVLSLALFLVAGFYFESLNIARQWFAIACVMNGLEWVGERNMSARQAFARYAVWVVLGSLMHLSCLIWLALWPLLRLRMTPVRAALLLAGCVALALVGISVARVVFAQTRFGLYLDPSSSVYVGPRPRVNAMITFGLTWAFPFVVALFARAKAAGSVETSEMSGKGGTRVQLADPGLESALVVCATLAFALYVSAAFLPFIVDRVARYFAPMLILLMPHTIGRVEDKRLRAAAIGLVLVAWAAATYVQVVVGGQYGVVPYVSVFGERAAAGLLS